MKVEDASILVGSLKGAAASIYLLLALTRHTHAVWEVADLCYATKYGKDKVIQGRQELISKGLAATVGSRFGLTLTDIAVQQLQLRFQELPGFSSGMAHAGQPNNRDGGEIGEVEKIDLPFYPIEREVEIIDLQVEKVDLATSGSVVVDQTDPDLIDQHQQQTDAARSKKSTSQNADETRRRGVMRACAEAGIGYPKNRELAGKEWTTGDRVLRMVRQVQLEKRFDKFDWNNPIGQAIRRLEDEIEPITNVEMDALEAEDQREREECEQQDTIVREQLDRPDPEPAPRPVSAPAQAHPSLEQPIHGSMKPGQVWQAALGELQLQMTRPTFETWVKPCRAIAYKDGEFIIAAPTDFVKDWLERKLLSSFKRSLAGILGHSVDITFVVIGE